MTKNSPKILRLIKQASILENKLLYLEEKPYGGGNPYYYCASCNRSMIEVSYKGHYPKCSYKNFEDRLKGVRKDLDRELYFFLKYKSYDSKSFKHFLWFRKNNYDAGLTVLIDYIEEYKKTQRLPMKDYSMQSDTLSKVV